MEENKFWYFLLTKILLKTGENIKMDIFFPQQEWCIQFKFQYNKSNINLFWTCRFMLTLMLI